jgi:hypothetical protein
MKDSVEIIAIILSALLGLGGGFAGIYFYWVAKVRKSYAAERDFAHLQNNQKQLVANLAEILNEFKEFTGELKEVNKSLTQIHGLLMAFDKEYDSRFDRLDLGQLESKSMLHALLRQPRQDGQ